MKKEIEKLTSFFFELGTLRKILRSHRQALLTDDLSDNIASHSFRTTMISYFIAKEENADINKVIKMSLIHDIEESRCGDQNWIHKKYVKVFEEEIRENQLKEIPLTEELSVLSYEYQKRETKESKIVKDADLLDQALLLREYEWQGNKEAFEWIKKMKKDDSDYKKMLYTKTAKKLIDEIFKQNPGKWWEDSWVSKRR